MTKRSDTVVRHLEDLGYAVSKQGWRSAATKDLRAVMSRLEYALLGATEAARITFRSQLTQQRKNIVLVSLVEFQQAFWSNRNDESYWGKFLDRAIGAAEGG